MPKFAINDPVKFAPEFVDSCVALGVSKDHSWITEMTSAVGKVASLDLGPKKLIHVTWDGDADVPSAVHASNLCKI